MEFRIAAVVITYNRLELLKQIINSIKEQTHKPDDIIVVNNSSNDGTSEWLESQTGLTVLTQPNIGSSGGQYTGIKYAYDNGYDWIWVMDDDVLPNKNCLEKLIENAEPDNILAPLRYNSDGTVFFNEAVSYNLKNPFKSFWNEIISEKHLSNKFILVEGLTFEGPIFHRSLIDKIGLPEKNFFIFGDDTEFFIRAKQAGFKSLINTSARLNRLIPYVSPATQFSWKNYFVIRNLIAIDVLHGNIFVRLIRPFRYLLVWLFRCKSIKDIKTVFKAFWNGYFYQHSD